MAASAEIILIEDTEVSNNGTGSLNWEWKVLPPLRRFAAMRVDAVGKAMSEDPRIVLRRVLYKWVFPLPPGPSKKETFGFWQIAVHCIYNGVKSNSLFFI